MAVAPSRAHAARAAGGLALLAAFVWSTYYFFTLHLEAIGVGVVPIVAYPFLAGGLGYLAYLVATGAAPGLGPILRDPVQYARVPVLLAMQGTVVVATFGVGPVDTSLLTLVGDVVLTPLLVVALFREGGDRFRHPLFVLGILVSTLGASLTIAAGGGAHGIGGLSGAVALGVPFTVAAYFIWTARAARSSSAALLVTPATLVAAGVVMALAPWLPGGLASLAVGDPLALLLLVVNGLLSFFVGPLLYFRAIARAGLLLPSVLMAMIPVFTLLLAVALGAPAPELFGALGVPVAAVGAYFAFRGESGSASGAEPSGG